MKQSIARRVSPLAGMLMMMLPVVSFADDPASKAPAVTVAVAQKADMVDLVPISGTLVARDEIMVHSQIPGALIDALMVDISDRVEKGDVLARLDRKTLTAQLLQAKAGLASAQARVDQASNQIAATSAALRQIQTNLKRAQTLRDNGTGTQASLDQALAADQTARANAASARDGLIVAQAQVKQAGAQLKIAELNIDHATLRAPQGGIISARAGAIGAITGGSGDPVFKIIKDGVIEMEAEAIETVIGRISPGDRVHLTVAGAGPVTGKVRRLAPTVDPVTRLGLVRVALDAQGALRAGAFAAGHVVLSQRRVLSVPTTAILTDDTGAYVMLSLQGVLKKQAVSAGLIWQGQREITQGLAAGDVVVARAGAFFHDGDRITEITPKEAKE